MIVWDEIVSIESVDQDQCYDITLLEDDVHLGEPNFIAEGVVVHNCQMDKRYIERKRGREKFSLHPLLQPILQKTYGVITYQEQVMSVLNVVGEIPWKDCWAVCKAMAKKKIEGFEAYKEMFIRNGQKNLGVTEREINDLWNQNESFAEYGFNFSHANAYTYISGRLLYLKVHFPHEFYTSILSCESLSEKMKDYKMEAKVHGIEMERLDINKSKMTFDLVGDTIYFGLSNVKGVGEEPAGRIFAGQPYSGFEDFLARFGTEANVLKPLIGLRCFREADPVTLWKFAEYYKDKSKKYDDKRKRLGISLARYQEQFEKLTGKKDLLTSFEGKNPFDAEEWRLPLDIDLFVDVEKELECHPDEGGEGRWETVTVEIEGTEGESIEKDVLRYYKMGTVKKKFNRWKTLVSLWNRYQKSVQKDKEIPTLLPPRLAEFDASWWEIDDETLKELREPVRCEEKYYGFAWVHDLEKSPDYKGDMTFDQFRSNPDAKSAPVEIRVNRVLKKEGKKTIFYQVECEDVTNETAKFNVWMDDWERWEPEFKKGNLLRVRLMPPSGGFPTYTFESPPRQHRWKMVPKNKSEDFRVVVMRPAKKQIDEVMTNEEAMEELAKGIDQ